MPQDVSYWINRKREDKKLDWRIGEKDWLEGYWQSVNHPHRKLILKALESFYPFKSLLEVGCNVGPNLKLIQDKFPKVELAGSDVNIEALKIAKQRLPKVDIYIDNIENSLIKRQFDIVLVDAVLMYIPPERILKAMENISYLAKKGVILVEWKSESFLGKVMYHHWARNYRKILKKMGWRNIKEIKIPKEIWSTENWARLGYIFVARPQ